MTGQRQWRAYAWIVPAMVLLIGRPLRLDAQETQTIKAVQFVGNTVLSESALRAVIESASVRAYVASQATADITRIEKLYAERGYTLARVRDAELLPDGSLRFTLVEGVIDRITVLGNNKTRPGVIRDTLQLRPGMVYHEPTARADRRRLADLGIFESVMLEPLPSDSPEKVRLNAKVKEARSFFISGAAAYGNEVGLIGYLDAADTNFLGKAQTLRLQWQRGINVSDNFYGSRLERRSAYQLSFDDPHLLLRRISVGFDVYHQETPFIPVFNSLDVSPRQFQFREGATIRVGTAITPQTSAYLHYRHDRVNFNDLPTGFLPPSELLNSGGTVGSVALRGVLNRRDHNTNPRRGYRAEAQMEVAAPTFGSSFDFTKFTGDVRNYIPMGRSLLLLRAYGGATSRDTPLSEQFWLGGYDFLRGYDYDEFHGTRAFLATAEYQVPLISGIDLALFTDYGYAWGRNQSVRVGDLRLGGGLGFRFLTPFGNIRLDLAMGRGRLHTYLSLGETY